MSVADRAGGKNSQGVSCSLVLLDPVQVSALSLCSRQTVEQKSQAGLHPAE